VRSTAVKKLQFVAPNLLVSVPHRTKCCECAPFPAIAATGFENWRLNVIRAHMQQTFSSNASLLVGMYRPSSEFFVVNVLHLIGEQCHAELHEDEVHLIMGYIFSSVCSAFLEFCSRFVTDLNC